MLKILNSGVLLKNFTHVYIQTCGYQLEHVCSLISTFVLLAAVSEAKQLFSKSQDLSVKGLFWKRITQLHIEDLK